MADVKITDLTLAGSVAGDTLVEAVVDPSGTPLSRKTQLRFHGTFENVTTDNATPAAIDEDAFVTYVTSDGSGLEQSIQLSSIAEIGTGRDHLIIFQTQTDPGDIIRITGSITPGDFLLNAQNDMLLLKYIGAFNTSWFALGGFGGFADADSTAFPVVMALGSNGVMQYLQPDGYVDFYQTGEDVTIVAGAGDAQPNRFVTHIVSDGSAGTQTITLGSIDVTASAGITHLFKFDTQTDPADVIVIDAADGIVGGEVLTLVTGGLSYALLILTEDGWLPWTFGGGTTTDATGNRTLQLADTGVLTWV